MIWACSRLATTFSKILEMKLKLDTYRPVIFQFVFREICFLNSGLTWVSLEFWKNVGLLVSIEMLIISVIIFTRNTGRQSTLFIRLYISEASGHGEAASVSPSCHHIGYERVYLPLHKVADTPFHIQADVYVTQRTRTFLQHALWRG